MDYLTNISLSVYGVISFSKTEFFFSKVLYEIYIFWKSSNTVFFEK